MTKYFLGLDWGKSKIGVAMADDETRMAFAHSVIKNDMKFFEVLQKLIKENDVETIVIGEPAHYAHAGGVGHAARVFGAEVAERCGVKVEFFQEIFTTKMAQSNLHQSGKSVTLDDQEAARLILQEWLDNQ